MDIEKVRALLCVIEEKSISAAANKMDYTPSGVSRMMTALEEELGFSLLIRKKEGVSVTEECKTMLPYMRAYIKSEEECLQMVSKIRGMEIGRVSIGTAYSEYYRWLSECIKDFHKKYPGICLELSSGYSSELVDKVMDHKLDLAIVSRRDNVEEWILLRRDPMVVWVPAEHRLAALNGVPIEEFAKENYIDSNSDYVTDNAVILEKHGIKPNIQIQSKDSHASWRMVEAGLGIGLNNYINSRDRIGDVKVLPLIPEESVEIGITFHRQMTLAGKIFIEHLKNNYLMKI